jgi:hypothetical protein
MVHPTSPTRAILSQLPAGEAHVTGTRCRRSRGTHLNREIRDRQARQPPRHLAEGGSAEVCGVAVAVRSRGDGRPSSDGLADSLVRRGVDLGTSLAWHVVLRADDTAHTMDGRANTRPPKVWKPQARVVVAFPPADGDPRRSMRAAATVRNFGRPWGLGRSPAAGFRNESTQPCDVTSDGPLVPGRRCDGVLMRADRVRGTIVGGVRHVA